MRCCWPYTLLISPDLVHALAAVAQALLALFGQLRLVLALGLLGGFGAGVARAPAEEGARIAGLRTLWAD